MLGVGCFGFRAGWRVEGRQLTSKGLGSIIGSRDKGLGSRLRVAGCFGGLTNKA